MNGAGLMDVGVDFVSDPIIGEKNGEEGADEPENPAMRKPGGTEVGVEKSDVNEIGSGIAEISEEGESGHRKKSDEVERGTEVRPGSDEPDDAYAEQDEVVEDATRLPESGGGGEEFAEIIGLRRGGGRSHWAPLGGTGRRIAGELCGVKYFEMQSTMADRVDLKNL
jgi:hypothetical protein